MPEAKGESNLRVAALIDCNAGRLTGHRFAAVGANNEIEFARASLFELNAYTVFSFFKADYFIVEHYL